MKVKRKHVHIREDCFDAEEKGLRVQVQAFRSAVHVTLWTPGDAWGNQIELTLPKFAAHVKRIAALEKRVEAR